MLSAIEGQLVNEEFEHESNEKGEQQEHNLKRRMYQTMMIPQPKLQCKTNDEIIEEHEGFDLGLFSCLEMLAYMQDSGTSESLMKIALRCEGTGAICFADSIEDMRALLMTQ